jgi:hypothetical protein
MRIGLFVPCCTDAFIPEVGAATLELLERFGCEVVYPRNQTCCGQPMANTGFHADCATTRALFVHNFSGFDYAVAPSGSSVHQVHDGFDAVGQTDEVKEIRARTYELAESRLAPTGGNPMSGHDAGYFSQRDRTQGIPERDTFFARNLLQQAIELDRLEQLPWPKNQFDDPASIDDLMAEAARLSEQVGKNVDDDRADVSEITSAVWHRRQEACTAAASMSGISGRMPDVRLVAYRRP